MAKFCSKCGMKLNEQTGKCPNCDEKTKMDTVISVSMGIQKRTKILKKQTENKKSKKKAKRKQ